MPLDAETLARHHAAVRRLAYALVREPAEAEDLAQEAALAALTARAAPPRNPLAWLKGVARRLAANRARGERRRRERHRRRAPPAPPAAPPDVVERLEAQRRVASALLRIEEPYRRTLYLRYYEDLAPAAIAERLGVPVNTVRTHLRRGLARLGAHLAGGSERRRALGPLLAPLLLPTPATAAPAPVGAHGVLLMSLTSRAALVTLLLLALGGAAAWLLDLPADPEEAPPASPPAALADAGAGGTDSGPRLEGAAGGPTPAPDPPGAALVPPTGGGPTDAARGAADRGVARFSGRVLDAEGEPLAGAPLRLVPADDSGIPLDPRVPLATARSELDGRFALEVATQGLLPRSDSADRWLRVHLVAEPAPGRVAVASFNVDTTAANPDTRERTGIVLRVAPTFVVACRVSDGAGRPVGGARCRWGRNGALVARPGGGFYEAHTDAQGQARLELPALAEPASVFLRTTGVRQVHVDAEGYGRALSPSLRVLAPRPGQQIDVEVVLPAGRTLHGRALDERGEPVRLAPLTIQVRTAQGDLAWGARLDDQPVTDEEGRFVLRAVPPGPWALQAWAPGHDRGTVEVPEGAGAFEVTLRRQSAVRVRYLDGAGRERFVSSYRLQQREGGKTNAWGSWGEPTVLEISGFAPGLYRATVRLLGRATPVQHDLRLVPGAAEEVTVRVPEATGRRLAGWIRDAGGVPLAGRVQVERVEGAAPGGGAPAGGAAEDGDPDEDLDAEDEEDLEVLVGADGAFAFEGLAPAAYRVSAESDGYAGTAQVVDCTVADVLEVALQLRRGATLHVRLPREDPRRRFRWQLQVLTALGEVMDVIDPHPDADGWIELAQLPPGPTTGLLESSSFRAGVVHPDPWCPHLELVEGEVHRHRFPREAGVTLRGQALGADGAPVAQRTLVLERVPPDAQAPEDVGYTTYGWKRVVTDDDGRFEAYGLLPGRYWVRNLYQDLPQGHRALVLDLDDRPEQTLVLRAR